MKFQRILVLDCPYPGITAANKAKIEQFSDNVYYGLSKELDPAELNEVEVLLGDYDTKIDQELLSKLPDLKYIGVASISTEEIDIEAVNERGILLTNNAGYCSTSISEFFFAVILSSIRELEVARKRTVSGDYSPIDYDGFELRGKNLGIYGLGGIGERVADIGLGFGMNVSYFSRTRKPEYEDRGCKYQTLDELAESSDYLGVFIPWDNETDRSLDDKRLASMRANCVIVNVCHTDIFDVDALAEQLREGRFTYIQTYFDTIPTETRDRLATYDNVIMYPSIAVSTVETHKLRQDSAVDRFIRYANGEL